MRNPLHSLFHRKRPRKRRNPPVLESRNGHRNGGAKRPDTKSSYPRYHSKPKRRRFQWKLYFRRAKRILIVTVILVSALFVYDLPDIGGLTHFTKAPSILIKSEDGQIIGSFGDIYGEYIPFRDMPASLVDAVIATEDRNFYHHFGVDPFGIARAIWANIRAHHVVQGGSTITQQVAKNVFLTPERSLMRKIKEVLLAIKMEMRFSKQDILSIYLNRVYLGAGNYGIDAAAHRYFDKSARDLNLSESSIIAGLLKAPSRFAPTSNPALSTKRAQQVLVNMQDAGFLTEAQSKRAVEELARSMSQRKRNSQSTLYFADWVLDQLPEYMGSVQEDIVVTTTLKPEMQALAEKAVTEIMDKESVPTHASQASLLAMSPEGGILAMIGGRNYAESQFNRTTQSLRQPGSAFKLFVYLAGLEDGLTPGSIFDDHPISIKIAGGYWQPHNYTNRFLGTITMEEAVSESVNTIAVQVAERTGLDRVIAMAHRLGLTNDMQPLPSLALGATEVSLLELTTAYAHMAADGAIVNPYGIVRIDNIRGEPLYERRSPRIGVAINSNVVGMMNQMLMKVVSSGTGRAAQIGRPVAGKTGTTSDYRDAWFMGFTPDLVTGTWVGNDNNEPMNKVTGGKLPAQIWHHFMSAALAGSPPKDIPTEGRFVSQGLPWLTGAPDYPSQPGNALATQPPHNESGRVNLGPSFWDKLFH